MDNKISNDIWNRYGLPIPPTAFGKEFIKWLDVISSKYLVTFVTPLPMDQSDLQILQSRYGIPHSSLQIFYQYCNPWGNYAHGPIIWEKVISRVYGRCEQFFKDKSINFQIERLRLAPSIWPIMLGKNKDIAAFTDQYKRLALIEISNEIVPARPLSIGLENYFISIAIAELLCGEGKYDSFNDSLADPIVIRTLSWSDTNSPKHPILIPNAWK